VALNGTSGTSISILLTLNHRNDRADLHAIGSLGHQYLGHDTLVNRLKLHRRLIGLNFGQQIARRHFVTFFDQPPGQCAFFHRG
jgi:hypothetical protein